MRYYDMLGKDIYDNIFNWYYDNSNMDDYQIVYQYTDKELEDIKKPKGRGTGGVVLFTATHEITEVGNGCYQYCISWTPTTLIAGGVGRNLTSDPESPLSIYVGLSKCLSISGADGSINYSLGAGIGLPVGFSIKLGCIKINDYDNNGCPCPDANNNSTVVGAFKP